LKLAGLGNLRKLAPSSFSLIEGLNLEEIVLIIDDSDYDQDFFILYVSLTTLHTKRLVIDARRCKKLCCL
jgi:hypothetical protein